MKSKNTSPASRQSTLCNITLSHGVIITEQEPIRALSWKQPYASAMLHGKIETRSWSTNYRGWVLICTSKQAYSIPAAKGISGKHLQRMVKQIDYAGVENTIDLNGYAIGIGKLVDCHKMHKTDAGKCYVTYNPDLYCHVYEHVQPIHPFKWKGTQGWSTLNFDQRLLIEPLFINQHPSI